MYCYKILYICDKYEKEGEGGLPYFYHKCYFF